MEASTVSPKTVRRANELYWGSDRSVNQIAEDLDLSKGALYGMIEPQATGSGCPTCGAELVFANRTAKERDRVECVTCDWEGSVAEAVVLEEDDDEPSKLPVRVPLPEMDPESRFRIVAGGALLGAAVGLALVLWARRR